MNEEEKSVLFRILGAMSAGILLSTIMLMFITLKLFV